MAKKNKKKRVSQNSKPGKTEISVKLNEFSLRTHCLVGKNVEIIACCGRIYLLITWLGWRDGGGGGVYLDRAYYGWIKTNLQFDKFLSWNNEFKFCCSKLGLLESLIKIKSHKVIFSLIFDLKTAKKNIFYNQRNNNFPLQSVYRCTTTPQHFWLKNVKL